MPMGNGQYTYREKGDYHASKAKPGAVSSRTGELLSDFARGRHSALAQVNYTKNRQYAHKKEAINKAKQLGYPDLVSFNNSPEGKTYQIYVHNKNLAYKKSKNKK